MRIFLSLLLGLWFCGHSFAQTGFNGGFGAPGFSLYNPSSSSVLGTCAASQAYFVRAANNIALAPTNLTPTIATWESAVDSLICGQVTDGTWTLKDIEYFFLAPTIALAEMNLVSSSDTLIPHGTLNFTANHGVKGDGSTFYFDTGYSPSSGQMTTTSAAISVCLLNTRSAAQGSPYFQPDIGSQFTSSYLLLDPQNDNSSSKNFFALVGTGNATPSQGALTVQGGFHLSRIASDSTHFIAYFNGATYASGGTGTSTGTIASNPNFYILANDINGSPAQYSIDTVAIASAGAGESATQVSNDHTRFSAALTAMSISSGC